jgi:hypothetical protein
LNAVVLGQLKTQMAVARAGGQDIRTRFLNEIKRARIRASDLARLREDHLEQRPDFMGLRQGDADAIQFLHLAFGPREIGARGPFPLCQLDVGNRGVHRLANQRGARLARKGGKTAWSGLTSAISRNADEPDARCASHETPQGNQVSSA